jgi:hypothetical protein
MIERGTPMPGSVIAIPNDGDWKKYASPNSDWELIEPKVRGITSFKRSQRLLKAQARKDKQQQKQEQKQKQQATQPKHTGTDDSSNTDTMEVAPTSTNATQSSTTCTTQSSTTCTNSTTSSASKSKSKLPLGVSELGITTHALPEPVRKTIGYVTSGSQSFARGVGHGVAFCHLPSIVYAQQRFNFVWIRQSSTLHYRAARFEILCD